MTSLQKIRLGSTIVKSARDLILFTMFIASVFSSIYVLKFTKEHFEVIENQLVDLHYKIKER